MRLVLAFIVAAMCFCTKSPTGPNSGEQPFTVCSSARIGSWFQIYACDSLGKKTGPVLAKVISNDCQAVNVPDGTRVVALVCYEDGTMPQSSSLRFVAHAGDYWNL